MAEFENVNTPQNQANQQKEQQRGKDQRGKSPRSDRPRVEPVASAVGPGAGATQEETTGAPSGFDQKLDQFKDQINYGAQRANELLDRLKTSTHSVRDYTDRGRDFAVRLRSDTQDVWGRYAGDFDRYARTTIKTLDERPIIAWAGAFVAGCMLGVLIARRYFEAR